MHNPTNITSDSTIPPFKSGPGFSGKVNDRNLPGSSNPVGSARCVSDTSLIFSL